MERMLRDDSEFKNMTTETPAPEPYWDPVLRRSRRRYIQFMRALLRCGLVKALPGGAGRERASIFFVRKPKKETVRVIVDARRTNLRFRTPPGVALCSAEGLTRIEVRAHDGEFDGVSTSAADERKLEELALFLGVADVQDAFHRFRLRDNFAAWFCLGSAYMNELRCRTLPLENIDTDPLGRVDLCWASLPLGFTWSLFFCQAVNESLMSTIPRLRGATRMSDKDPPALFGAHDDEYDVASK